MKIVECLPNGYPVDETHLNYPRIFTGVELLVFDTLEEYDQYIRDNIDESTTPPTE